MCAWVSEMRPGHLAALGAASLRACLLPGEAVPPQRAPSVHTRPPTAGPLGAPRTPPVQESHELGIFQRWRPRGR